jgi:hypothetical protein
MTIPVMYLWPLGCLTLIGFVHTLFAVEEVVHKIMKKPIDAAERWKERRGQSV